MGDAAADVAPVDDSRSLAALDQRRYDVDWLRTLALVLLIFYHVAIAFQEWGWYIGFPITKETLPDLWTLMSAINVWRIPLLFVISGMGVRFAMGRRDWLALLKDRGLRIGMPYVFGLLVIGPLLVALPVVWFYDVPYGYEPGAAHLWFLANILAYVVVLMPLFYFLKNRPENRFFRLLRRVFSWPGGVILVAVPLMLESLVVNPDTWESYVNNAHGWVLGAVCFFLGFLFVSVMEQFWPAVRKIRWPALVVAVGLYLARVFLLGLSGDQVLTAFEATCWILAIFGFASLHLNRPSRALGYMSKAVYPVYIVHLPVQFFLSYFILRAPVNGQVQLVLLLVGTYGVSVLLYELVLRRIRWTRPLFGMKLSDGGHDVSRL